MKKLLLIFSLAAICLSFTSELKKANAGLHNTSFQQGEVLEYKLHYGFVTAGEGKMQVYPKLYKLNGKPCYKLDVSGRSTGSFAVVLKIKDIWRSYIDTATLMPQLAYRDITEGKYELKEKTHFDRVKKEVRIEAQKKNKDVKKKNFDIPADAHDMVSAYYYLRNVDYSSMKKGDMFSVNVFVEDELYDFKVKYVGKEEVKVKAGKFNCIKLVPFMPENSLFDGEGSIRFWLSDDANRIPIRVEADMFVGAVQIDLKGYDGLRHDINKIK